MKDKRKSYFTTKLTTREETGGDKYIEGYFVVFNQETELWRGVYEKIDPHALDESIRENDIRCLFNHDSGAVLGRTSAQTFRLSVDDYGVYGSVKVNDNDSMACDVYARVARGDISGCSFGFFPDEEDYTVDENGNTHWTVLKADTHELSVCTFPAYPQTDIQARRKDFENAVSAKREKQKIQLKERIEKIWH